MHIIAKGPGRRAQKENSILIEWGRSSNKQTNHSRMHRSWEDVCDNNTERVGCECLFTKLFWSSGDTRQEWPCVMRNHHQAVRHCLFPPINKNTSGHTLDTMETRVQVCRKNWIYKKRRFLKNKIKRDFENHCRFDRNENNKMLKCFILS